MLRSTFGPRRCRIESLERRDLFSVVPPQVVDVEVASTSWSADFTEYVRDADQYSIGYSIPVGSAAQLASLTWSNIDQIIIRFSEDVHIDAADLSISGVNTVAYEFSDFHYDPIAHAATWTLPAPIDKDRLHLDLDANGLDPVRDLDGNILDGEWVNKVSTVSGDGTPGGDFQFTFHVQPADVDNNGKINSNDSDLINSLNGKSTIDAGYITNRDIDGSGLIDSADWQEAVDRYLEHRPVGSPAGVNNDAPTTSGFDLVEISDAAIDVAISLTSGYGDAESGPTGLTYSIMSNSDGSLFDTASINADQQLVLNAASGVSGRATIVVRATDAAGLFTDTDVTVDVDRQNQPPQINDFYIGSLGYNTWVVSGYVTDPDDDVSDFIVNFYGAFSMRSAVNEEGYFMFAVILEGENYEDEYAFTTDPHGLQSNVVVHEMFIS